MDGSVEGFRFVTGLRNYHQVDYQKESQFHYDNHHNGNKVFCWLHLPNGDYQWM